MPSIPRIGQIGCYGTPVNGEICGTELGNARGGDLDERKKRN